MRNSKIFTRILNPVRPSRKIFFFIHREIHYVKTIWPFSLSQAWPPTTGSRTRVQVWFFTATWNCEAHKHKSRIVKTIDNPMNSNCSAFIVGGVGVCVAVYRIDTRCACVGAAGSLSRPTTKSPASPLPAAPENLDTKEGRSLRFLTLHCLV